MNLSYPVSYALCLVVTKRFIAHDDRFAGLFAAVYRIRISHQYADEDLVTLAASSLAGSDFLRALAFVAGVLADGPGGALGALLRATPGVRRRGDHLKK